MRGDPAGPIQAVMVAGAKMADPAVRTIRTQDARIFRGEEMTMEAGMTMAAPTVEGHLTAENAAAYIKELNGFSTKKIAFWT